MVDSTLLWRDVFDGHNKRIDVINRVIQFTPLRSGRLMRDTDARPAIHSWADRSRLKTAATVRADVMQNRFDTGRAECAFVGAYSRFGRINRQVLIAIFTVRPEFQHLNISLVDSNQFVPVVDCRE